jgi:hypothetical protein
MDFEVGERRASHRVAPPAAVTLHATMRPGCHVVLVDVTDRGALIEAPRPLRPGATVQLTVNVDATRYALSARVLRCAVAVLEPSGGVTYRGGLLFESPVRWPWVPEPDPRVERQGHRLPRRPESGNALPGNEDPHSRTVEELSE